MAFKMTGSKFYGDRSRKEMRQDIREERKSLKEGGATKGEVKEYNQYQRGRKKEIRADVRGRDKYVAQGADMADVRGDRKAARINRRTKK